MEDERFDALLRGLGRGASRRGVLGVLAGLAGLSLSEGAAKKGAKVAVCHYDADADTYVSINVSQDGWDNSHSKHEKDFQRGDVDGCCNDSDCSQGLCNPTTGTCSQTCPGCGSEWT